MRRELAIKVDYLEAGFQERLSPAEQPAALPAVGDRREGAASRRGVILYPALEGEAGRFRRELYLSVAERFRRSSSAARPRSPTSAAELKVPETEAIIQQLF